MLLKQYLTWDFLLTSSLTSSFSEKAKYNPLPWDQMGNSDSLMFEFTKPPNSIYESLLITPFLWSTSAYERQQQLNVSPQSSLSEHP